MNSNELKTKDLNLLLKSIGTRISHLQRLIQENDDLVIKLASENEIEDLEKILEKLKSTI